MKIFRGEDMDWMPASHESDDDPGVWKRVLMTADAFIDGRPQMLNWARMPAGKGFASHYHEDMQEVFVIVTGTAEIDVGGETEVLYAGDAVEIPVAAVHRMRNIGEAPVEYIAIGVSMNQGGRTMVVDDMDA